MVRPFFVALAALALLIATHTARADEAPETDDSPTVEAAPDSDTASTDEPANTAEPASTDEPAAEPTPSAEPDSPAESKPAAEPKPAATKPAMPAKSAAPGKSPAPAANQKYDLRYKFKPGETMRSEVVQRATVQTTIEGTSQTAETNSKSIKAWKIDKVGADGTVTFVHFVESIDMWQRTQGRQEVRYNSATDKEVPPGYEDAAKAVGVPLTIVTMNDRGKILKRQEKRLQPGSISTQMTMPLPDHPIAVGETWTSPIDIEVSLKDGTPKKIQTRQKFTLERVMDDLATIGVESQIMTPVNDPAIEAQLIQRLSAGTVRFDITAGRVIGQQLDLDRRVIGFSGAASSMHYVTRFTEQLLPGGEQTARAQKKK